MRNIAIITARSGSKGIPDKNIREIAGKPMLAYSIQAAIESGMFDTVMVSTDSEKYAEISRQCGAEVPFLRSEITSSDTASSWAVIKEVLENYSSIGQQYDSFCLLQPTSPLRTADDIKGAYEFFLSKDADAIAAVCESDIHMQDMLTLDDTLSLEEFRKTDEDVPRQMKPTCYRINGSIFIRRIKYEAGDPVILSEREYAYIMDRANSMDIDTEDDYEYAEYLMKKRWSKV